MSNFAKKILLTLSALLAGALLEAQTADEFFKLGNSAYKRGDYSAAAENYLESRKAGGGGAELFYNIANAYAKLGKASLAQLYYLRSIYENPRLRESYANLDVLAKNSNFEVERADAIESVLAELSESEWVVVAVCAFWGALLFAILPPLYNKRSAAFVFLSIISLLFFCSGVAGTLYWRAFGNRAVAVGENPSVRISPTPDAPVSAILADGQIVDILKRRGNYLYVETKNGKRGWAESSQFPSVAE